jgi:hypothetical protein
MTLFLETYIENMPQGNISNKTTGSAMATSMRSHIWLFLFACLDTMSSISFLFHSPDTYDPTRTIL